MNAKLKQIGSKCAVRKKNVLKNIHESNISTSRNKVTKVVKPIHKLKSDFFYIYGYLILK